LVFALHSKARRCILPNRVRYPTDWSFASGCSPPHLTVTQLPSTTELDVTLNRTCTDLICNTHRRTSACLWQAWQAGVLAGQKCLPISAFPETDTWPVLVVIGDTTLDLTLHRILRKNSSFLRPAGTPANLASQRLAFLTQAPDSSTPAPQHFCIYPPKPFLPCLPVLIKS